MRCLDLVVGALLGLMLQRSKSQLVLGLVDRHVVQPAAAVLPGAVCRISRS